MYEIQGENKWSEHLFLITRIKKEINLFCFLLWLDWKSIRFALSYKLFQL